MLRLGLFAALVVGLAVSPGCLGADLGAFLPRPLQNGAWVDVSGIYESDELKGGASRLSWNDTLLKERVSVFSLGYIYHPRFLTYYVSLSEALKQEKYVASYAPSTGFRNRSSFEYDTRITFLPEHPYNLELFARRYEPLYREQYATPPDTVAWNRGADFRYRKKPMFLRGRYTDDRTESTVSWSDVRTLDLGGSYFRELGGGKLLSFDAAYTPSKVSASGNLEGRMSVLSAGNTLALDRFRLVSTVSNNEQSQEGGGATASSSSRQFTWLERFGADFTERFRTNLTWRYQTGDVEYGARGGSSARELTSVRKNFDAEVKYQLYESLQPVYAFRWDSSDSSGGSSTTTGNSLTVLYTKSIPRGRILLNVYGGVLETENAGQTDVADEAHPGVAVPGAFLLDNPTVDPASVIVFVREPQAPFELIQLAPFVNYTLSGVGDSLQVTVVTLPPRFVLPGSYEFRVSYALTGGDFRMRTRNLGGSLNMPIFGNVVTPFVRVASTRSTILAGTPPAAGLDSDVFGAGVSFFKGPLRGRLEFQEVRWQASPYSGWRVEGQYIGSLFPTTNVNATLQWNRRDYWETAGSAPRPAYSQTVSSAAGSLQQYLFRRQLSIAAGGTLARVRGPTDSDAWGLNATLAWRVGKLEVSGAASYTTSESTSPTIVGNGRTHQLYVVRLRRSFF